MNIPGTRPAALLLTMFLVCALLTHAAVMPVAVIAPSGHADAYLVALDVCGQGRAGDAVQAQDLMPDIGSAAASSAFIASSDEEGFPPAPDDAAASAFPREIFIPPEHPQP